MLRDPDSDRSPLYDVRNPALGVCEDAECEVMFRGRLLFQTICLKHACEPVNLASGGGRRDRTDDLMLAKHALSQLSYAPVPEDECSDAVERNAPHS